MRVILLLAGLLSLSACTTQTVLVDDGYYYRHQPAVYVHPVPQVVVGGPVVVQPARPVVVQRHHYRVTRPARTVVHTVPSARVNPQPVPVAVQGHHQQVRPNAKVRHHGERESVRPPYQGSVVPTR